MSKKDSSQRTQVLVKKPFNLFKKPVPVRPARANPDEDGVEAPKNARPNKQARSPSAAAATERKPPGKRKRGGNKPARSIFKKNAYRDDDADIISLGGKSERSAEESGSGSMHDFVEEGGREIDDSDKELLAKMMGSRLRRRRQLHTEAVELHQEEETPRERRESAYVVKDHLSKSPTDSCFDDSDYVPKPKRKKKAPSVVSVHSSQASGSKSEKSDSGPHVDPKLCERDRRSLSERLQIFDKAMLTEAMNPASNFVLAGIVDQLSQLSTLLLNQGIKVITLTGYHGPDKLDAIERIKYTLSLGLKASLQTTCLPAEGMFLPPSPGAEFNPDIYRTIAVRGCAQSATRLKNCVVKQNKYARQGKSTLHLLLIDQSMLSFDSPHRMWLLDLLETGRIEVDSSYEVVGMLAIFTEDRWDERMSDCWPVYVPGAQSYSETLQSTSEIRRLVRDMHGNSVVSKFSTLPSFFPFRPPSQSDYRHWTIAMLNRAIGRVILTNPALQLVVNDKESGKELLNVLSTHYRECNTYGEMESQIAQLMATVLYDLSQHPDGKGFYYCSIGLVESAADGTSMDLRCQCKHKDGEADRIIMHDNLIDDGLLMI
jgi:hypothetical protein